MNRSAIERTIEAVWRMESAKIIAKLARMLRDVGLAEEIAQDAWVAALEQWTATGLPENPGAWLMATAKNRAIDQLRRRQLAERKSTVMTHDPDLLGGSDIGAPEADSIGDDLLRLMFVACHPVLPTEARVTLTLRLLGGLTPAEIARAFLTSESAIQQRIVRAKRTLSEARVPFEVPGPAERAKRLGAVLEVIYLIFNEGYAATSGEDWMRPALCEEALRLGRVLAEIDPATPEIRAQIRRNEGVSRSRFGNFAGHCGGALQRREQQHDRNQKRPADCQITESPHRRALRVKVKRVGTLSVLRVHLMSKVPFWARRCSRA